MNKGLQELAVFVMCVETTLLHAMRHFFPLLFLSACCYVLGWSLATQPFQQDNLGAAYKCMKLHPERYCRLTYAPNTVAP